MSYSKADWLPDASSSVPGAPRDIIESTIMKVIADFCETTFLWVKKLDLISIVAGTSEYALVAPTGVTAHVVNIDRAEFSGSPMNPDSMDLLDRLPEAWRDQTGSTSDTYMVNAERVLRLRYVPTENVANALAIWAILKPKLTATTIPDFIYEDWFECILNGVLGELFRMPRRSWTNIQEAEYFTGLYEAERSRAKGQKTTGKTKLSLRVQQTPFSVY